MHGAPGVGQEKPISTRWQSDEQPSPSFVLPSSQASPGPRMLSPHTIVEWHFPPSSGGHTQYASTLQVPEQQSPGNVLPSSHSSVSWFISLSPHAGATTVSHPASRPAALHGSTMPPSTITIVVVPALPPELDEVPPPPLVPPPG